MSITSMTYSRALRSSMGDTKGNHNKWFICSKRCRLSCSMIRILKRPLVVLACFSCLIYGVPVSFDGARVVRVSEADGLVLVLQT